MQKIKEIFTKYRELILYVFFGGLTTVVNFIVYTAIFCLGFHYLAAQVIAWAAAVAFAFVVNKLFVFGDHDKSARGLLRQIGQFVGVRIASGVLETALLWLMVDVIRMGEIVAKIPVAVLTIVINYVASKLFIFRKSEK